MDKDNRVLSTLMENLEDIKYKLSSIDYDRKWIDSILPEKKSRSYINIKNVLESLVMKTVEGKGYDEDIASICNQHKQFLEKHLQFQSLFSSEDYFIEARNLPNMPLRFEFLHSSFMTFQDFLGDILHSICLISSCQFKLPSKILVKDLLKIKNQYLSIWDLIFSVFEENRGHRGSDCSLIGESKGIKSQVCEIQKCLQMSLKEMSRVKLDIEHYFKCNLMELQFTKCSDAASGERVYNTEDILENKTESEYLLTKEMNLSTQDITTNKMNAYSFLPRNHLSNLALSSPSLIPTETLSYQTESKGSNSNGFNFPPKTEIRHAIINLFVETPSGDFFHKPIIFPSKVLFNDPTTVLKSKTGVNKINSFPKIYSVDSFDKNTREESTEGTGIVFHKNSNNEFHKKKYCDVKVKKDEVMPPTTSLSEEDLFNENKSKSGNHADSYSICLQEKISSLFGMLQSSETIQGEDIFKETPLKIEQSDFSYTQTLQNYKNSKFNTKQENFAGKVLPLGKYDNITKLYPENRPNEYEDKIHSMDNYNKKIDINKVNYEIPFYFKGSRKDYNIDKSIPQTKEVIYDKRSIIQSYHTKEANVGLKPGSTTGELSTFSLWPVTADYIQVSKSKRQHKCESVSSDNSILLSRSFGKSFYSLHLNKSYEQKQFYDGDLLVLENPQKAVKPASSSNSPLNQSYSIFNQEENDKPNEKSNRKQNVVGGKINNKIQLLQNKNIQQTSFKKERDLNNKIKPLKDVNKSLAVHYKDCGDSFKVTNKNFSRENFDFLKVNGFDDNNNWNSFISIFTSKVGPTAQINHHRMFRKVINTFTTDSLTCNNVFGNVHTLTSNGGPFRLFDINGYPLTDSSGNVLKDPYGKSVVTLDSTGFPKNDIKVFDAAGNSPNDINFDPTQKPKTNSIIIKLTDSFKRALHLYDKYGRPLTDCSGKLLVNIHGRPLLRFDNFGRPNTDYRGGPLYTDNGHRWSFKTGDSLSSNQLSNESLMQKKLGGFHETESRQNSFENFSLLDKSGEENRIIFKNTEPQTVDDRKFPILNTSESDIWVKVENVLQKLPKNKKIDPKASQTSVIINNVTITQKPIEKEFLKSIIYHNNIIQQDVNHINRTHSQLITDNKTYLDFKNINSCLINKKLTEKSRMYSVEKLLDIDRYEPYSTMPFPFQNDMLVKSACSKLLNFDNPKYLSSNKFFNEQSLNLRKAFTCDAGDLFNSPKDATLTCYQKNGINNTKSCVTLKNNDYLNNLCNQILKQEINCLDKNKHSMKPEVYKNKGWTDTSSNTEFPSSMESKYTTEFTKQTESPFYFSDSSNNQSQDIKVQNKYYNSYFHQQKPLNCHKMEKEVLNKEKYCSEFYQNKKGIECTRQQTKHSRNEQIKEQFQSRSALPTMPTDDTTSIKILNKDNKHYEIKVTEMLSRIINPKINFGLFRTGKSDIKKPNSLHILPTKEIETSINKLTKENSKNLIKNKYTTAEKINNSLFRFSSDIIEPTPRSEKNSEASYLQKAIYKSNSNVCKVNFKDHHEETKYLTHQITKTFENGKVCNVENNNCEGHSIKQPTQSRQNKEPLSQKNDRLHKNNNINRKTTYPVKKPVSSNRECNLASFFGSPVKYVLNKLDGKRSSKPNKTSTSAKKKPHSNSNENAVTKRPNDAPSHKDKMKPMNDIKTLYDITKSSKKSILSSSEKAEINSHNYKLFLHEQDTLLAFRSKSCTGVNGQNKDVSMCYSGDSQSANHKKHSQGFPFSRNKLQKSMSATSYGTEERSNNKYTIQRCTKYEQIKGIPKNGGNLFKPNMTKRKYTKLDYGKHKNSKSQKGSSGRNSKSPLSSSRTKAKEISLFRKVEPEGKYMLKIKR